MTVRSRRPRAYGGLTLARNIDKVTQRPWIMSCDRVRAMGHKIGYVRVSTADQNPQLQLDALARENCLKTYVDTATGTRADRPQWIACLADLRPGDTLVIWKIDRLGRSLRDLIDIVTTLEQRGVGVRSLSNGHLDTTTAQGKLVFGMFALIAVIWSISFDHGLRPGLSRRGQCWAMSLT